MKMNKIKSFCLHILILFTGMNLSDIIWHFRFNDVILRRELILYMQEENTYFLDWFILSIPFLIIMWGLYFILIYRLGTKQKIEGKRQDGK